ncbi:MAG: gamma-glutamyltransferase, partial [Candidatus Hydrogenedentales bacterium]
MKRRTFMKLAGVASVGALASQCATVVSKESPKAVAGEAADMGEVPIREEWLAGRNQNRSTVTCRHGIVCTSQPLSSMAGVDILKSGGNAFDAAVCASAMMSLVEPMSCGPGGDLFAIIWTEKEQKLFGLNASGRAPYDWSLDVAKGMGLTQIPSQGPLAWSVPGCVSGWSALLERFGTKSFGEVLAPAIGYAREGFPVSPIIARGWGFPASYDTLARTYMPGGKAPGFGDIFCNAALADTFEQIAKGGADAFYKGEIADRIVKFSQEVGGRFSKRDFEDHTADWVEPIGTNYRGFDVWEIPPNGQGLAALQTLNILENFEIKALEPNSAEYLHLFIEAKKLAYEDRAVYYADPAFADVPVAKL